MSLVSLLFTAIITIILYSIFSSPIILAIGISIVGGVLLDMIYEEAKDNFYILSIFILISSLLVSISMLFIKDSGCRIASWVVLSSWIYYFCSGWAQYFSEHIYNKHLRWMDNKKNRTSGDYTFQKYNVAMIYQFKYFLYSLPYIIINLILIIFIIEIPAFSFVSTGALVLALFVILIMMYFRGILPHYNDSKTEIHSFRDVFYSVGDYFSKLGKDFVAFFVNIGKFFKNLFKKKSRKIKTVKKTKTLKTKTNRPKLKINIDFSFLKRIFKRRNYSSSNGYYSHKSMVRSLVPLGISLLFLFLSFADLIEPFANVLATFVNYLTANLKTFVLSGLVANEWLPKVADAHWLLILPYGALVLVILVLSFVLDIALLIVCLLFLLVMFIVSIVFGVTILYIICPALIVLEIITLVKIFRNDESQLNKVIIILSLILTIICTVLFYTWKYII